MRKFKFIIAALLLTGCGYIEESDYDSSGDWPNWTGDSQESTDRFTINYDPAVSPGPWLAVIEQVWLEVQVCVGIAGPNPGLTIEYTPLTKLPINDENRQIWAYIKYNSRYIRVADYDLDFNNSNHLRHEFVHYLLWLAGESSRDLSKHNSPFYTDCLV